MSPAQDALPSGACFVQMAEGTSYGSLEPAILVQGVDPTDGPVPRWWRGLHQRVWRGVEGSACPCLCAAAHLPGISRIRFIHFSNQIPCSSNVVLCCFWLFSDSSNRGMSKQYPLTVLSEAPNSARSRAPGRRGGEAGGREPGRRRAGACPQDQIRLID